MRILAEQHPLAAAVYFLATAGVSMFCMDPVILALSLAGALLYFFLRNGLRGMRTHLYTLALFLLMTLINPFVSHNGVTVLFVMNHNPVTLEALLYGAASATMIVSVLYWFRSFSQIMTSDKLLYLFGVLSPKLALILSMALRYVPLMGSQTRKVRQAQKALGLFKEDNLIDSFRGELRVFSVMVTWALENGIVTADSMTGRGYGTGRRSRFSLFRFTLGDGLMLALSLTLLLLTLWGISNRSMAYYPAIRFSPLTIESIIGYGCYALLTLLPTMLEGKEALRWHCLRSNI